MNIKTFEGASMKQAVQALRSEFGKEAVILNTKEKRVNGAKLIEITAAESNAEKSLSYETGDYQPSAAFLDERLKKIESTLGKLQTETIRRKDLAGFEADLSELKMLTMNALAKNYDDKIFGKFNGELDEFQKRLKIMGIEDVYLADLAAFLESRRSRQNNEKTRPFLQKEIVRWLARRIRIFPRWEKTEMQTHSVQVLVGAAGVGKTTSAAKIAAKSHLDQLKVGLATYDHKSLASSEQLRVFSKVIGVKFNEISRLRDLGDLVTKNRDLDLIIIDTANRSPREQRQIDELKKFQDLGINADYHLVLPMTERSSQLDRTVRAYSRLGISSLIFTKLDESWSYGEIFNLSMKWKIPISYFGIGNNVPEDLERATKERVIERLVGI